MYQTCQIPEQEPDPEPESKNIGPKINQEPDPKPEPEGILVFCINVLFVPTIQSKFIKTLIHQCQCFGHLLELCLKSTYFRFRGHFYEQIDGAAMGFPVSPVVANIYMEHFKQMALESACNPPRAWKCYVDDIFC